MRLISIRLSHGRLRYMTFRNALRWAREARAQKISLWRLLELSRESFVPTGTTGT